MIFVLEKEINVIKSQGQWLAHASWVLPIGPGNKVGLTNMEKNLQFGTGLGLGLGFFLVGLH